MSERQLPPAALAIVDKMIRRMMLDLEKLVGLRAELTGEDPLGDRGRRELANEQVQQDLERMRSKARERDPEEWAKAHARAREIAEWIRRERAETSKEPPVAVRVATETVRQWRDACRAESEARRAQARSRAQKLRSQFGSGRDERQPPRHGA